MNPTVLRQMVWTQEIEMFSWMIQRTCWVYNSMRSDLKLQRFKGSKQKLFTYWQ